MNVRDASTFQFFTIETEKREKNDMRCVVWQRDRLKFGCLPTKKRATISAAGASTERFEARLEGVVFDTRRRCGQIECLDEAVDVIFKVLLASAGIWSGFAFLNHVSGQRFKIVLACFDVRS